MSFEIYHERIYIVENKGLEQLLDDVRFIPNLRFNVEKLVLHSYWNPICVRRPVYAYTYIKFAYV